MHSGLAQKKSPTKDLSDSSDVKVVLGNKHMMADNGIAVSKAVDEYMRDMEVRALAVHAAAADCLIDGSLQRCTWHS